MKNFARWLWKNRLSVLIYLLAFPLAIGFFFLVGIPLNVFNMVGMACGCFFTTTYFLVRDFRQDMRRSNLSTTD